VFSCSPALAAPCRASLMALPLPPVRRVVTVRVVLVGRDDAMSAKGLRCPHYAQMRTSGSRRNGPMD
jgi:hypothetical protein